MRGNASTAGVRVAIEHVFAQKCRLGLVIRLVSQATARVWLANMSPTLTRLVWFATRTAPA
jgi:hypothetical protein